LEVDSVVENEDGLVNLDPLGTGGLELRKELAVDGEELGEEREGLEASRGITSGLAQNEVRDGAKDDRAGFNTSSLGFLVLLNSLVEVQLEVDGSGQLRDDVVVVGVEPKTSMRQCKRDHQ